MNFVPSSIEKRSEYTVFIIGENFVDSYQGQIIIILKEIHFKFRKKLFSFLPFHQQYHPADFHTLQFLKHPRLISYFMDHQYYWGVGQPAIEVPPCGINSATQFREVEG
jgi:hypothetical protein